MDEDAFRREFGRQSVFRQAGSLDLSYVPPKLYCRDEVIKSLIHNYRRILEEKEPPSINCLLLGKGGVGKTAVAKHYGNNFRKIALEKDVNLFIEYYNCINFNSKSKIIRELLGKYTHGSGRGFSDDEALKLILTKLINDDAYMFLIIDEVQQLDSEDVLAFLEIAETFGHHNAKISILLVSRIKDWMRIETERILSRLNEKIILEPYDFDDSNLILQYRSEIALKENVVNDDILAMISQIVVENKNMRHGIEILRKCGLYVDKEGLNSISADMVREASNEVYTTFRGDIIDQINEQELLALYGIVRTLINNDEPYALVDDAFEEYKAVCENYSIEPHVKMSYRKYVRQLRNLKIIASKTVRIEEAQRGRHLKITLLDIPPIKLEELLDDLFEQKFLS